jgi:Protein of unknown function (DUF3606)
LGIRIASLSKNHLMANNNNAGEKPDRIYLYEAYEVMYWTHKFGISVDKLKKAVRSAGHRVTDVEQYIQKENNSDNKT